MLSGRASLAFQPWSPGEVYVLKTCDIRQARSSSPLRCGERPCHQYQASASCQAVVCSRMQHLGCKPRGPSSHPSVCSPAVRNLRAEASAASAASIRLWTRFAASPMVVLGVSGFCQRSAGPAATQGTVLRTAIHGVRGLQTVGGELAKVAPATCLMRPFRCGSLALCRIRSLVRSLRLWLL